MLDWITRKGKRRHIFRRLMPCHSSTFFNVDDDPFVESPAQCFVRETRLQQNDCAPIACLPPELLAAVFVRCIPVSPRAVHSDFTWLNIARVTSLWRNVALSCPDFWTTLILSRPKSIPIMLARSKTASLIVRADLRRLDDLTTPVLFENTARLGTLDLRSPQRDLKTFMSALECAEAAPRLRCISIVNSDTGNLGEGGMWLPRDLFRRSAVLQSQTAPSVSLHLEACAFPWDSRWYSQLTHLHLEHISPAQSPTMETLLGILLESRLTLQTLTVIHCCPSTSNGVPVHLPQLTALTLKSNTSSTCVLLFHHLVIPPSASLDIMCYPTNAGKERKRVIHDEDSLISRFCNVAHRYDDVRITHRDDGVLFLLADSTREWTRKLAVIINRARDNLDMTQVFVERLDFSSVSTLHLQNLPDSHSTLSLWDKMGRKMRAVRTVHFHRSLPKTLLEFLLTQAMLLIGISDVRSCFHGPDPEAFRGLDGRVTHAWPSLCCLSLHGIKLAETIEQPNGYVLHRPSTADLLRALLWARRAGQARIWQLEIEDCENVCATDLAHLRLFADITYDGKGASTVQKEEDGLDTETYSLNVFTNLVEYPARPRGLYEH